MAEAQARASLDHLTARVVSRRKHRHKFNIPEHLPLEPSCIIEPPAEEGKPLALYRDMACATREEYKLSVGECA
ncbi:MAG: hypothetical protein EON54_25140 [Alcaligenaceae bacterium]|nr:MAG: hypothetical protein EON54_25140 [Alcaligenaceae bacterium]